MASEQQPWQEAMWHHGHPTRPQGLQRPTCAAGRSSSWPLEDSAPQRRWERARSHGPTGHSPCLALARRLPSPLEAPSAAENQAGRRAVGPWGPPAQAVPIPVAGLARRKTTGTPQSNHLGQRWWVWKPPSIAHPAQGAGGRGQQGRGPPGLVDVGEQARGTQAGPGPGRAVRQLKHNRIQKNKHGLRTHTQGHPQVKGH